MNRKLAIRIIVGDVIGTTEQTHEALQQKTGKWIEIDMDEYKAKCSSCGIWSPIIGNYCPDCGCRNRKLRISYKGKKIRVILTGE